MPAKFEPLWKKNSEPAMSFLVSAHRFCHIRIIFAIGLRIIRMWFFILTLLFYFCTRKPSLAVEDLTQKIEHTMNRLFFNYSVRALSLLALIGFVSCEPQDCTDCEEEGLPATLVLTLESTGTKSTTTQTDDEDNCVNLLDVYIFNAGESSSSGYGQLDAYQRFEGSTGEIRLTTTTGPKKICVIVNPKENMTSSGVTNLDSFKKMVTSLTLEQTGDLTMYGETDAVLSTESSVSVAVSRFISRITVSSIRTDFSGTPYEGMTLTDCKLYLINVHNEKSIHDGADSPTQTVLNDRQLMESDLEKMIQSDLLADNISAAIGDEGYSTPHYLYCYANETSTVEDCTMAVLEAVLNGNVYYYPIPVNQTGYGYQDENGHHGIRRNTQYSYSITVTRPGSTVPYEPVEQSAVVLTVNVDPWNVIPEFNKVF